MYAEGIRKGKSISWMTVCVLCTSTRSKNEQIYAMVIQRNRIILQTQNKH